MRNELRYHIGKCLCHISNALTHYLLIATKAYQKNRPFGLYRRTNKLKFSTTIADKIGFKKLDRIRLIILFVKSNYIK